MQHWRYFHSSVPLGRSSTGRERGQHPAFYWGGGRRREEERGGGGQEGREGGGGERRRGRGEKEGEGREGERGGKGGGREEHFLDNGRSRRHWSDSQASVDQGASMVALRGDGAPGGCETNN